MLIRAEAEGTDTYELNRNLVLTDGARADSVPNLEIETGEIKGAGHASATGRFDDLQLFYLQARGIPEDEAKRLVVRGFFVDVIREIPLADLRDEITAAIEDELATTDYAAAHPADPQPAPTRTPARRTDPMSTQHTLEIKGLTVSVETEDGPKEILRGVDLTVKSGETHAIMGPNGSGKSTLAYSIAGHPKYTITGGTVTLDGEDVLAMSVDERARAGLFLAMQYPVEVPGVTVSNFLRTAKTAIDGEAPKLRTWVKDVKAAMGNLKMDPAFAERSVNEGFSGGEKKRHEILQMELLQPKIAILDETDSGLDVDALKIVSEGVNRAQAATSPGLGVLLITHYTRILRYIKPDFVHVFIDGKIVEEGGPELADRLEDEGYDRYATTVPAVQA